MIFKKDREQWGNEHLDILVVVQIITKKLCKQLRYKYMVGPGINRTHYILPQHIGIMKTGLGRKGQLHDLRLGLGDVAKRPQKGEIFLAYFQKLPHIKVVLTNLPVVEYCRWRQIRSMSTFLLKGMRASPAQALSLHSLSDHLFNNSILLLGTVVEG